MLENLQQLETMLSGLPGVGGRSSSKLALHLLQLNPVDYQHLQNQIDNARETLYQCSDCALLQEKTPCPNCEVSPDNHPILCVTESLVDYLSFAPYIEENAKFFSLDGKLSPLRGVGPNDINIEKLILFNEKIKPKEIIFALNADVEGEATVQYIIDNYLDTLEDDIKISRIGFGLTVGSKIQSSNARSIQKSLEGRIFY